MGRSQGKRHAHQRPAKARAVRLSDSGLLVGFVREHEPEWSLVGRDDDRRESLACLAPRGVVCPLPLVADEAVLPSPRGEIARLETEDDHWAV